MNVQNFNGVNFALARLHFGFLQAACAVEARLHYRLADLPVVISERNKEKWIFCFRIVVQLQRRSVCLKQYQSFFR